MNKQNLLSSLPPYYRKDKTFNLLMDKASDEIVLSIEKDKDLLNQFFPQTATWGISLWEEICGIPINEERSLFHRRSMVVSKLSQGSPMTRYKMERIIKGFVYDVEIEERYAEYAFDVVLKSKEQFDINTRDINTIIGEHKPAHLDYTLQLQHSSDIDIFTQYNNYLFQYLFTNTYLCGTEPTKSTLGRIVEIVTGIRNELLLNKFGYELCGTKPIISTIGRALSANAGIESSIRNYMFEPPLTNDLLCGTEPITSTVGRNINTEKEIKLILEHYDFTYELCGTDPIISTKGKVINIPKSIQLTLEPYAFNYDLCGVAPTKSITGRNVEIVIENLGELKVYAFNYPATGTLFCGEYPN